MIKKIILLIGICLSFNAIAGTEKIPVKSEPLKIDPLLLPFNFRLNIKYKSSNTEVVIFNKDNVKSAYGEGTSKEFSISLTGANLKSNFYILPDAGFFIKQMHTKDFAEDSSYLNEDVSGFLQGNVRDFDSGESIDISSLEYMGDFYSLYFGINSGYNYAFRRGKILYNIDTFLILSVAEWRRTEFKNSFSKYDTDESLKFLGFFGVASEFGMFSTSYRCGLNFGIQYNYFPKFDLPNTLIFKKTVKDREIKTERGIVTLYKPEEIEAVYSEITSFSTYVSLFYVF